jgi:hypothetical protein
MKTLITLGLCLFCSVAFAQTDYTPSTTGTPGFVAVPDQSNTAAGAGLAATTNGVVVTLSTNGGTVTTPSLIVGAATNTPSFTLIQTNWIDGGTYTNVTGRTLWVMSPCTVTTGTGVAGTACYALKVPGQTTNFFAAGTLATSLAMPYTNTVQGFVPAAGTFIWTNLSSGTGSSAAIVKGGQYIVL